MNAPILTQTLHFSRSTHGTHRFDANVGADPDAHVTSLYIRKAAFQPDAKPPAKITITVEAAE